MVREVALMTMRYENEEAAPSTFLFSTTPGEEPFCRVNPAWVEWMKTARVVVEHNPRLSEDLEEVFGK